MDTKIQVICGECKGVLSISSITTETGAIDIFVEPCDCSVTEVDISVEGEV
jgi:hypothetical protein